jgi:hypothetical protein
VANETAASTFSIPYASLINDETEFLFMTGDGNHKLVAKYKDLKGIGNRALTVSYNSWASGSMLLSLDIC